MVSFETSDLKKIGKGLTGFGVIFTLVGVILLFDKSFLAIGNIFLFLGVILTVGLNSLLQFFLKSQNYKGSVPLVVGFVFVISGWPIIGMFAETYGFIFFFSTLAVQEADEFLYEVLPLADNLKSLDESNIE